MALERVAAIASPYADERDRFVAGSTDKRMLHGEPEECKMTHKSEERTGQENWARKNKEPNIKR